ncbi:MAG: U32 family peptidase, partial [Burkholderiales bacterium]|nr:U32 family peptidase [Burkholderiales bacterium]
ERAAYPTLCKGRFEVEAATYYAIEEPASLNTIEMLPEFLRMGVRAVKIEGRQRSPAYVGQVTRVWRQAIDAALAEGAGFSARGAWLTELGRHAEGSQQTLGAFSRPWK